MIQIRLFLLRDNIFIHDALSDLKVWMKHNFLKLNGY